MNTAYNITMRTWWNRLKLKFTKDWTNDDPNIWGINEDLHKEILEKAFRLNETGFYVVRSNIFKGSIYLLEFPLKTKVKDKIRYS